ncbi:conserved exported protein of unknown function [Pseudodesulfovibrio profundus]|uniref:VCBS repeat-containing protein n=1 Tax=Pseudodesulfovibrio profundus TaxID=57320 RepID=A0A2C8F7A0_9BACT|nr:FG-GAP-like repeat-containing protein [Pseudodesulfovibrio profundus]SOB58309.1 conserved exported protein of unknown function [Pseudodesulfovibrio profundus]
MFNKRFAVALAALVAVILFAGPALAQTAKKYAVMPFTYAGPKKYSYFPKAFQASLNNDLEWSGRVVPADDSVVNNIKAPESTGEAINSLRSSGLDYVITGSIAIIDKSANLSINAVAADGSTWEKSSQMGIDEITPWLDEQSKAIQGDLFKRPGYSTAAAISSQTDIQDGVGESPVEVNSAFISADDRYQTDTLNPQFRYEGGTETIGRWRSQTLRYYSTSMVVEDADGDGNNEIFILHSKGIAAYRYNQGQLKLLDNMDMTPNTSFIRLEATDLDRDNVPELIVASYQMIYKKAQHAPEGRVRSHVLSFKNGKFEYLVKDYRKFLGVLRIPPMYSPILVAQDKGSRDFFDPKIEEAYLKDGDIVTGNRISRPEFANIYNMAYLPDGMGFKYVVIDDFHKMRVYGQTLEQLSITDMDTYNTSGIGLEYSERPLGLGGGSMDEMISTYNVPFRMITARLSTKDKYELLVNKDLSIASQVFERFKYFSQGEIHSLVWDGVGMNLAWKTRRIKGQVSDVYLADINNDGEKQLCVLLNTFPGGLGFKKRKTVVLAYDLNM